MSKPDDVLTIESMRPRFGSLTVASLLTLAILALDTEVHPGTGVDSLYVVPVLLTSYAGPPYFAFYGAWITSLLIAIRLLPYPLADLTAAVYINRVTAIVVVWTTA